MCVSMCVSLCLCVRVCQPQNVVLIAAAFRFLIHVVQDFYRVFSLTYCGIVLLLLPLLLHLSLLLLLLPAVVVVVAFNVPFDYFDISNCCRCSFYGPVDRPLSLAPHSIWKHDLLLCKFDDSVIPHNTLYNLRRRRRLAPKKICLQCAFLIQKSPENFTW